MVETGGVGQSGRGVVGGGVVKRIREESGGWGCEGIAQERGGEVQGQEKSGQGSGVESYLDLSSPGEW